MSNRLWTRSLNSAPIDLTDCGINIATLLVTLLFVRSVLLFNVLPTSNKCAAIWLVKLDTETVLQALRPPALLQALEAMAVNQLELLEAVNQAKDLHLADLALAELALLDHQDRLAKTEITEMTVLQAQTVSTDLMHLPGNNHLLLTSASTAHQDPLDQLETPDQKAHQELQETTASQVNKEVPRPLDLQDHQAHQAVMETQAAQDLPANQVKSTMSQELQDHQDQLDLQEPQANPDRQEDQDLHQLDRQDPLEMQDHQDQTATLAPLDNLEATDKLAPEAVATTAHLHVPLQVIKLASYDDPDAIQTVSFVLPFASSQKVFLSLPFICNFIRHWKT